MFLVVEQLVVMDRPGEEKSGEENQENKAEMAGTIGADVKRCHSEGYSIYFRFLTLI